MSRPRNVGHFLPRLHRAGQRVVDKIGEYQLCAGGTKLLHHVLPEAAPGTAGSSEALVAAQSLGFPVAMKIHSPDITHKSDVDGVHLNITSAAEVRGAFNAMVERAAVQLMEPAGYIEAVLGGGT